MNTQEILSNLIWRYGAPDRHHHGLLHISDMIHLSAVHSSVLRYRTEVKWAIWFHDAIFDTRSAENERLSADFARELLKDEIAPASVDIVERFIMSSRKHLIPEGTSADIASDMAYFLDFDMWVLGADDERFDRYEEGVRREYGWLSDADWAAGRSDFLTGLLGRTVFLTEEFRDRYEDRAKANIMRSIQKLAPSRPQVLTA